MANNKYTNKVIYNGNTLIDLTSDTVTADKVLKDYTFHAKSGETLTGTCTYNADTTDATAGQGDILLNATAYVNGVKLTGNMPNKGAWTGTITSRDQQLTVPNGYHDGSGYVAISADDKAKLIPGNILENVTILGVTGTCEPSSDVKIEPSRTVTPTAAGFTVTPSSGYDVMSEIKVAAIPYTETDNTAGGKTVTIAA